MRKFLFPSRADLGEDGARLVEQDEGQAQAQRQAEGNQADAKTLRSIISRFGTNRQQRSSNNNNSGGLITQLTGFVLWSLTTIS